MARFNTGGPAQIPGPGNVAVPSASSFGAESTEGLDRGIQNLARGIQGLGDGVGMYAERERKKKQVADYAKAEALWTAGAIEIGNEYSRSTDFNGMSGMADKRSLKLKEQAAALISDAEARDLWLADAEQRRMHIVDGANDRAYELRQRNDKAEFAEALVTSANVIADPSMDEGTRGLARKQLEGTIAMGLEHELILPAEASTFRREHLDAAEEQLAINRANLGILRDPQDVMAGLAIPLTNTASTAAEASMMVNGGKMPIPPEVAGLIAPRIGDKALPSDPKLAEAYLKDPDVNAKYSAGLMEMLGERFNGDMSAAVIASAPGGSMPMAERWVKSGHDEAVLPDGVRDHYRKVMNSMTPEAPLVRLPIVATNSVDLAQYDVAVLDRFEKLQSAFGTQMAVMAGDVVDPTGRTLTIDVKKLKEEERARLIGMASAMGFAGIGVGKDTVTLDTGDRRLYSEDGKKLPKWAQPIEPGHNKGEFTSFEQTVHAVSPEYAAISFDNRLKLYERAKAEHDRRGIEIRSGIAIAVDNAPVAISQFGEYSGTMPVVDDFVHAYGASEGVERFKAFNASVESAELAFGMRTMSAGDIADTVEAARPTATGDMAATEAKRFQNVTAAGTSIIEQRKSDPAGYVMQAFPNVGEAWGAVMEGEGNIQEALTVTAEAQTALGMPLELMPKAVADQAATTFNNAELPQADRIGAVVQVVAATTDRAQQEALFAQLVKSGVPKESQGAFEVMMKGTDPGAAERLFQAAMFDPSKMPGKLPETDATINQRIQEIVFDEGQIGDVFYGITDGSAENIAYASNDGELFLKSVKLRLATGQASTVEDAIAKTVRDRFGDVRVVTGKSYGGGAGMKITLPRNEPAQPYELAFGALLPKVGEALMAQMTPELAGIPMSRSEMAIATVGRDQYIAQVLEEGYFTNADDDQFVFIDPYTQSFVPSPEGGPMLFSRDEVLTTGMAADSARRANRPAGYPGMSVEQEAGFTRRMQNIYGSSYGRPARRPNGE